MHAEILKLLHAGVVEPCSHTDGEYISPIFSRPKKNGSVRIILNLKDLNDNVEYHHFKMDNRQMAARLMTARVQCHQHRTGGPDCTSHDQ